MVCLGLEPGMAEWKAQTNSLSYGGTPPKAFIVPMLAILPEVMKEWIKPIENNFKSTFEQLSCTIDTN